MIGAPELQFGAETHYSDTRHGKALAQRTLYIEMKSTENMGNIFLLLFGLHLVSQWEG